MKRFENDIANFSLVVSYKHKMFMMWTPRATYQESINAIKLLASTFLG
jgi:hypothetical protein